MDVRVFGRRDGSKSWYERVGHTPAQNKDAVVMLAGVRYTAPALDIDYYEVDGAGMVVTIGSSDRSQLEEFAEDLAAVDIATTWFAIRSGDEAAANARRPERHAQALESVAQAIEMPPTPTGRSLEVVIERMGRSAADVVPPTPGAIRTRSALVASYERLTGRPAPF